MKEELWHIQRQLEHLKFKKALHTKSGQITFLVQHDNTESILKICRNTQNNLLREEKFLDANSDLQGITQKIYFHKLHYHHALQKEYLPGEHPYTYIPESFANQLRKTLDKIHQRGYCSFEIKPENVIISKKQYRAAFIDFDQYQVAPDYRDIDMFYRKQKYDRRVLDSLLRFS